MNKRINRLKKDYSEQVDSEKWNVIITPGKQLGQPDDSWYPEYLNTIYSLASKDIEGLMAMFEIPENISIKLKRLEGDEIRAYAKKHNSILYSINISEGVVKQAYLASLGFLSNNIFRQILSEKIYPKDTGNIAVEFIMDVMTLSFQFTLFHEFFHIALGHLDYLDSKNAVNILFENQPNPTSASSTKQAIEFQADLVAASIMTQSNRFNNFLLGMGFTVFLDTFNYSHMDVDKYKELSHPHPLARLLYSASRMYNGEVKDGSEQFNSGSSLALKSFKHYEDGLLFNSSEQSKFTIEQQFSIAQDDSNEIGFSVTNLWLELPAMSPTVGTLSRWFWGWTFDKVSRNSLITESLET